MAYNQKEWLMIKVLNFILMCSAMGLMAGCSDIKWEARYPTGYDRTETHGDIYAPRDTIWKHGSPINRVINGDKRGK